MKRSRTGGVRPAVCLRCRLGEHDNCVNLKALINKNICDCRPCRRADER